MRSSQRFCEYKKSVKGKSPSAFPEKKKRCTEAERVDTHLDSKHILWPFDKALEVFKLI